MKITGPLIINIDDTKLSPEEARIIENDLIGSVILFSHNFKDLLQIKDLIKEIKNIKKEILISIDHEGGRVQRFRNGFTKLPSFENIGREKSLTLSKHAGYISAYESAVHPRTSFINILHPSWIKILQISMLPLPAAFINAVSLLVNSHFFCAALCL